MGEFVASLAWITSNIVGTMVCACSLAITCGCNCRGVICSLRTDSIFVWWTVGLVSSTIDSCFDLDKLAWSASEFSLSWSSDWSFTWESLVTVAVTWLDASIVENGMFCNASTWITGDLVLSVVNAGFFTVAVFSGTFCVICRAVTDFMVGCFSDAHGGACGFAVGGAIDLDDETGFAAHWFTLWDLWMSVVVSWMFAWVSGIWLVKDVSILIVAHDVSRVGDRPWLFLEFPSTRFFPCWIAVLPVSAHAFDVSLFTTLLEKLTIHVQLIGWVTAEKLGYWKVFDKNILNLGVEIGSFCIHAGTRDTWGEFGMGPGVISLTLDLPSTLRSVSLWADSSTVCTVASDVSAVFWQCWLVATIMPLLIWSFIGFRISLDYQLIYYSCCLVDKWAAFWPKIGLKLVELKNLCLIAGSESKTSSPAKYASCTSHSFLWNLSAVTVAARIIESFIFFSYYLTFVMWWLNSQPSNFL